MKVLALDTASDTLSIAVVENKNVLGSVLLNGQKNHSVTLLPAIENLLASLKLTPKELDRIVVSQGPGSYTGLRIGVTLAKTLAWTLKKELVGVSSLKSIAASYKDDNVLIAPIIDARRQNVYTGLYRWSGDELLQVAPDRHVALTTWLKELKAKDTAVVFVGETTKFAAEILAADFFVNRFPQLDQPDMVSMAMMEQASQPVTDLLNFVPEYLKLVEAEEKWQLTHPGVQNETYVEKI